MTQGEKVGRDLFREEKDAFIKAHLHLDLTEGEDAWGRPKFIHSHADALFCGWMKRAAQIDVAEVAELRGKVGEVERGVALIRAKTIGELHIPEADAILDEIAEICDALLRKSP